MNNKLTLLGASMIAAMAAPSYADEFAFEVEGEVTIGANSDVVNNSYLIGEVEFSAGQVFNNGFGWALTYELEGENFGWDSAVDYDDAVLLEFITPVGTLAYGDMNKKGASELFYNDLDSMNLDVVRYKDKYPSLRWHGSIGDKFSYAISSRNVINGDDEEYSIGLGYKTDIFEFGLAWDNGSVEQAEAIAATAVFNSKLGNADAAYTLSYIKSGSASSLGLGVEVGFDNGLSVEASYAFNDVAGATDGYAFGIEYETGPLAVEAEYEYDGSTEEYEIALAYTLENFAPFGTTLYAGVVYEEGDPDDTGYYAGVGFGIAKNAVFGVAYSETDEGGGLEVLPGWSAMLTLSF